jgi:hypothetical protein
MTAVTWHGVTDRRVFRVFVSSTFAGMESERDELVKRVFRPSASAARGETLSDFRALEPEPPGGTSPEERQKLHDLKVRIWEAHRGGRLRHPPRDGYAALPRWARWCDRTSSRVSILSTRRGGSPAHWRGRRARKLPLPRAGVASS